MLSICINVKNGERYLRRTLLSVSRFEDVVLLDNYSTDNTVTIAKEFPNVRVYDAPFEGMGKARNLIASYAKYDWVLFVDCDEVLDSSLVEILLNYKFDRGFIYSIYRRNYYDGKLIESSSWGNDWIKRLYNRNDTRFAENQVHDNFIDNLSNIRIKGGFMIHFPYEKISQLIDKMQFYSTLYAEQHYGRKKPKLWTIPFRAFFMFIKCYIIKGGIKDGYEGLIISVYNSVGVWSKYIKLYEKYNKKNIILAFVVDNRLEIRKVIQDINKQNVLPEKVLFLFNDEQDMVLFNNITIDTLVCDSDKVLINESVDFTLQNYVNNQHLIYHTFLLTSSCIDMLSTRVFVENLRNSLKLNNRHGVMTYTKQLQ